MLQPIRRAAAKSIKPKVSEQTWAKIRKLDPRKPSLISLHHLRSASSGYASETRGGASLRMWEAYFPKAQIVGLDIHDKSFVNSDRIRAYQGSQTDATVLREISRNHGKFKIIIDDGSHRPEHVRKTFKILFRCWPPRPLRHRGHPDLHWPRFGGKSI